MVTSDQPNVWCIGVQRGGLTNFGIAVQRSTWGSTSQHQIAKLKEGDILLFGHVLSSNQAKSPPGFPRVSLDNFKASLAIIYVATVTSPPYEDSSQIWNDQIYPYRVKISILGQVSDTEDVLTRFGPAVADGIRRAFRGGNNIDQVLPNDLALDLSAGRIDSELAKFLGKAKATQDMSVAFEMFEHFFGNRYDVNHAAKDLFMPMKDIVNILNSLLRKKNVILQGPPGVGKSYMARRLAFAFVGSKDSSSIEYVQFHQSLSYEDFVIGYKPTKEGGFVPTPGTFVRFCQKALKAPKVPHVLIIDELNRGNLSKILGELFLLIESDKRITSDGGEWHVDPRYDQEFSSFGVPENVYILGLMNTADRSLAMVDYALRRRFAFFDIDVAVGTPKFAEHLKSFGAEPALIDEIVSRVRTMNERISSDPMLGPGYVIGHSYFCPSPGTTKVDSRWYQEIIDREIAPLLREYWFDTPAKVSSYIAGLRIGS